MKALKIRFSLATLAGLGIAAAFMIALIHRGAVSTPFSDEYSFGSVYQNALQGQLPTRELFAPHFGHVYVVTKLLLWLVVACNLPLTSMMYGYATFQVIYTAIILKASNITDRVDAKILSFLLLASFALLSAAQWENYYWAIQISIAMVMTSCAICIHLLAKMMHQPCIKTAVLAMGVSLASILLNGASFSTILLSIVAITASASSKSMIERFSQFFALILPLLLVATAGFIDTAAATKAFSIVARAPEYLLTFFGSSLLPESLKQIQSLRQIAGLAVVVLFFTGAMRRDKTSRDSTFWLLFGYWSLIAASSVCIARLADDVNQPDASRYYQFSVPLLLSSIYLCTLGRDKQLKNGAVASGLAIAFAILLAISVVYCGAHEWKTAPYRKAYLLNEHEHLCNGQYGELRGISVPADFATVAAAFCRN